ncbi:ATP-binding protein [Bacillus salipaludis]|uniref:ATP-binding protein n=1 Tax=Bacillus salipaludis TaxID=2547811 RepID=UPI002E1A176C|nr:ATP-binding protein [Bacillus salipaludis]
MEKLHKSSIVISAIYVLSYYLVLLLGSGNTIGAGIIALIGPLLSIYFVGISISKIEKKKDKKFWQLIFIGLICYFIGEVIWRYHISYLKTNYPFPGWANIFYNVFVILYSISVLYKVLSERRKIYTVQLFFDSFIIMTVVMTITWVYFISPILYHSKISNFHVVFSLSYMIAYFGVLIGVILVLFSSKSAFPPVVLVINTTVMIIYMLVEAYYLYKSIYYTYHESLLTPVWVICLLLIGLSSFYDGEIKDHSIRDNKILLKLSQITSNILPYLCLAILVILAIIKKENALGIYFGGTVILFLIVVRQVVIIFENESLVRQLKKRTRELESTQLELLESQEKYKSLFDYHPDAIFSIDRTGKIISSNYSFEKISGYSLEDWNTGIFTDRISNEHLRLTILNFQRALRGKPESLEIAIKRKTGQRMEIELTFVPITVNNIIIGVYGIAKDITEKKRTKEIMMKYEKLEVVSRLAAGVAHEIRNPLTTIKGFLQLSYSSKSSLNSNYLDLLLEELNTVEKVINEFLSLANPHHETVFKKSSIKNMLQEVINQFKINALLNNSKIITKIDSRIPFVECIESQLKQVFINLIQNAIEATEKDGYIYISVKRIDNLRISISFTDEGCGISEERLHRLGEPYYSTKEKGTGIGLMLSYKIIKHHHGEIFVTSKLGQGTKVEIIIPISQFVQKASITG